MKDRIKYISLIAVFIILVFSITITNLLIKYDESGSFKSYKEYYEIRFNNAKIEYDIDTKIKLDNDNSSIHFEISDLNDFIEEKVFYIDVTNLGNKDAYVTNMYLSNIDTNENGDKVDIYTSINNGDRLFGGEKVILIVKIKYNSKESKDKKYYNFNINYAFDSSTL